MLSSRLPLALALSAALAAPTLAAGGGEKAQKAGYAAEFTAADAAAVEELFVKVVTTGEGECCKAAHAREAKVAANAECSSASAAKAAKSECSSSQAKVAKSECSSAQVASAKAECSGAAAVACNHEEPWEKLSKVLAWKPAAWKVVKPLAFAKFEGEATENQRRNVMSLLAWQYSEHGVTIASEIVEQHPETQLTRDQLMAFAEAGSHRFWERVVEMNKSEPAVLPAAMLTLHGKKADTAVFEKAVAQPIAPERLTETWVAALALHKLGQPEHLENTRAQLHDAALGALDEGDVELAAQLALSGEFLQDACSSYKAARLSFLDTRRAWHCRERAEEIQSADDVFALVEHLSAL